MPISGKEEDKEFKKLLQNPPKPINNTEVSPDFKEYLDNLGSSKKEKPPSNKEKKYTLFCPSCRRPTLKKGPQGYACGFCGLTSNSPLRMSE